MLRPDPARIAFLLFVPGFAPSAVDAATLHVPSDFPTIQAGLDAASVGDTVLVACGAYAAWNMGMKSGVCLRGETGSADCVVVNGGRVGYILSGFGLDDDTLVEGITFANARSDYGGAVQLYDGSRITFRACRFEGNQGDYDGGAVGCRDSHPLFEDCTFFGNHTDFFSWFAVGGGGGVSLFNSTAGFAHCVFGENLALAGNGTGGGLLSVGSTAELVGCEFRGNRSLIGGAISSHSSTIAMEGGLIAANRSYYSGGGMYSNASNLTLRRITFDTNRADSDGGGLRSNADASLLLDQCAFSNNLSGRDGGGACFSACRPALTGCRITSNSAGRNGGGVLASSCPGGALDASVIAGNSGATGGGVYLNSSQTALENLTVVTNVATAGAGLAILNSQPVLSRSVVAFNYAGEGIYCSGALPRVGCTDIFGNSGGDWVGCVASMFGIYGNFTADPLFCGLPELDLTLDSASPCLPGRHPHGDDCELIGALGLGQCGATASAPVTWGSLKTTFASDPR